MCKINFTSIDLISFVQSLGWENENQFFIESVWNVLLCNIDIYNTYPCFKYCHCKFSRTQIRKDLPHLIRELLVQQGRIQDSRQRGS